MRDDFGRRKRIKLTEGELALGCWLYLTYRIITDKYWDRIYEGKSEYLHAHDFATHKWINGCKLCDKYINFKEQSCGHCPLKGSQCIGDWCGCGTGSWYDKTCLSRLYTHKERISSALNICNVLAKELKKERRRREKGRGER